jgi:hypothetical protein
MFAFPVRGVDTHAHSPGKKLYWKSAENSYSETTHQIINMNDARQSGPATSSRRNKRSACFRAVDLRRGSRG